MKLLYIANCDLGDDGYIGVKQKIDNQLKVFQKQYKTYLLTQKKSLYCLYEMEKLINKKSILTNADLYLYIKELIIKENIDYIYIRYIYSDKWFINLLKNIKKKKIILEFPTYPYDVEYNGTIELEEDIKYRGELRKYVKMTTNYNGLNNIFKIPSIPLNNGVRIEDLSLKKNNSVFDKITLIAVANMSYWQGYDRLIRGLANYYAGPFSSQVYLKLIGNGGEIHKYKSLVQLYGLEEYVEFLGSLTGQALNNEFDCSDIAIGTLGMYRKNSDSGSPIKTKEYCARGIPIVLGHKDVAFNEDLNFIHRVKNDESDINIKDILTFYSNYHVKCNSNELRKYAEVNLTWENILKPIIEFYEN